MTRDDRLHRLERAARRAAEKAARRHPGTPVTRDELLQLRIPTAEPWKRIVVGLVGFVIFAPGLAVFIAWQSPASIVGSTILTILGFGLLVVAIRGRRRTVQSCIDELGSNGGEALLQFVCSLFD